MTEITEFRVVGMTCSHCEHAVADEISKIPSVTGATANASTGTVRVEATDPLDRADVAAAVDEAGYELA